MDLLSVKFRRKVTEFWYVLKWRGTKKELPPRGNSIQKIANIREPAILCFVNDGDRKRPFLFLRIFDKGAELLGCYENDAGVIQAQPVQIPFQCRYQIGSRCDKCRFSCFERDRLCGKDGLEGLTGTSPVMDEESCPAMQIFGGFRIKQAAQGKIYPIPDCRILSSAKASEQSLVFVWRGSDSGKIILFPIWDLATCQCRTYVDRRSFKRVLHKMLSGDDHKLRVGFENFVIHRRLPGEDLWCTRIFEEADGPDSQPILRVKSS